jgi:segregation and condensation protein A
VNADHSTDRPGAAPVRVTQPSFHGPLDLLLYLVRKHEVDIREVSLAKVADEFLETMQAVRTWDVDWAGDFLVTAASLMELKSKALLPAEAGKSHDGESPARNELVRQLLEYRKFKDAARALEESADRHALRLARHPLPEPGRSGPTPVKPVELWDLVAAFARLMRETQAVTATTIQVDDTPQHVYEERILDRLERQGRTAFRDLFEPPLTKVRLIGYFLAILELIKGRKIDLDQPEAFGEIWLMIAAEKTDS